MKRLPYRGEALVVLDFDIDEHVEGILVDAVGKNLDAMLDALDKIKSEFSGQFFKIVESETDYGFDVYTAREGRLAHSVYIQEADYIKD